MSDTPAVPVLDTPNLRLRALAETDAVAMHEALGDPETMRFWDSPPSRDLAETADWIRESRGTSPIAHAAFAVVRRADDRMIAMVNYHRRQPLNHRLAVGWIVTRPWWRQGIMREAMPVFLAHCFDALGTHRIEAHIEPENTASIRLAESLGFQREGLMRDWLFVSGQPRPVDLYALLRPDWALIRDQTPVERDRSVVTSARGVPTMRGVC